MDGKRKAKRQLCAPPKEYAYCGGTSNLRDHLNHTHPLHYQTAPKQATLGTFAKHRRCPEGRAKEITEFIVKVVALDLRPLRLVEGRGFCELLAFFEPGCNPPTAAHISALVRRKHLIAQQQLKDKLGKEALVVASTTNVWTSIATELLHATMFHVTGK